MTSANESLEKTRAAILKAAAERFHRFGYGKTNVAEIADDCRMSAGNLYRYFTNKLDIAEAIMRDSLTQAVETLLGVVRAPGPSACERLESFILEELRTTYRQLDEYPTLVEQVRGLSGQVPMLANEYLSASRALLAEILTMGNASGAFKVDDVFETAEMIQAATMKFRYPQIHSLLPLDELEREARGVMRLLVDGIAKH